MKPRAPHPKACRRAAGAVTATLVLGAVAACSDEDPASEHDRPAPSPEGSSEASSSDAAEVAAPAATFSLLSAGDVLPHMPVVEAAADPEGGVSFLPLMEPVRPWIEGADLALCSMEVPLAPEGTAPSGYPEFGAPEQLIPDLGELGFHGCNTATNHSVDRGIAGLEHTLEVFDEAGMGHVGTARTAREGSQAQMYRLTRDGREITVAHLSTTMLHNITPPQDPWRVTDVEAEELTQLAAAARQDGADLVVASVHWGEEYVHEPGAEEQQYAQTVAAGGEVDLIYGNHSHTPQPIDELAGGPEDDGMWVVWSMGNFLSNQDEQCCVPETAVGTMVMAEVDAQESGPVRVTELRWTPVTVDRAAGHRGIRPLHEVLEDGPPPESGLSAELAEARESRLLEVMDEETMAEEPPDHGPVETEVLPRRR